MTPEEEKEALIELFTGAWYLQLPEIVKKVVEEYPPVYIYRFKNTKKQFFIERIEEPLDKNEPITFVIQKIGKGGLIAEMGMGLLDTNKVFGVKPEDIERVPPEDM